MPTSSGFERMLRESALRVTRPRLAVPAAVRADPHADSDSIFGGVRRDLPEVSHQAVYDVLRALTAAELVRRIQPSGSVLGPLPRVCRGTSPGLTEETSRQEKDRHV